MEGNAFACTREGALQLQRLHIQWFYCIWGHTEQTIEIKWFLESLIANVDLQRDSDLDIKTEILLFRWTKLTWLEKSNKYNYQNTSQIFWKKSDLSLLLRQTLKEIYCKGKINSAWKIQIQNDIEIVFFMANFEYAIKLLIWSQLELSKSKFHKKNKVPESSSQTSLLSSFEVELQNRKK